MDPLLDITAGGGRPAHRGCGAGHRRALRGTAGGDDGDGGLLFVLSEQEPRRVRRRRAGHDATTTSSAREVALLRNHGAEPKYLHKRIGGNFRLDALQAAVLRVKLPHLPAMDERPAARTPRATSSCSPARRRAIWSTRPAEPAGYHHIYNQYVIRVPDRDRVRARARRTRHRNRGLLPGAVPSAGVLRRPRLPRAARFPHAERAADTSLALPIYAELTEAQQAAVVGEVVRALRL